MKKRFAIAAAIGLLVTSTWAACRSYTYTTTYQGRTVTCFCTDCGYGANCNCV